MYKRKPENVFWWRKKMILNYKFKNFMSFRENVEFSMLAPKSKVKNRFPDNFIPVDTGAEILKTAVIVGENAGGKSNFVRSLDFLKMYFTDNERVRTYKSIININNIKKDCPKEDDTKLSYEIEILVSDGIYYLYCLETDFLGVVNEKLCYKTQYKQKYRQVLSATRDECEWNCQIDNEDCKCRENHKDIFVKYKLEINEFESEIKEQFEKTSENQKNYGLFISKLALLGSEHAIRFTEYMKNCLCPETNVINYDIYKSMQAEEEDLRILKDSRYLEIFRMIDYSIVDLKIDDEKPFSKTLVVRKRADGTVFVRELASDSSGVREFFAWAVQIFKVVYENKVIFADEMDRVLNPVLSDRVISFICGKEHNGQFVFTTHNVLHLDLKNYMKEQIYFITKDIENLESEMYSLADFPEIRYETTKIYEFYMKGILGGTAVE